jgi:hypothetical protein
MSTSTWLISPVTLEDQIFKIFEQAMVSASASNIENISVIGLCFDIQAGVISIHIDTSPVLLFKEKIIHIESIRFSHPNFYVQKNRKVIDGNIKLTKELEYETTQLLRSVQKCVVASSMLEKVKIGNDCLFTISSADNWYDFPINVGINPSRGRDRKPLWSYKLVKKTDQGSTDKKVKNLVLDI